MICSARQRSRPCRLWHPLPLLIAVSLVSVVGLDTWAQGTDKNGVSPNVISLPSVPGSIRGLGETFQPMLNTGTAKYNVSVEVPPGVNGHTPSISLKYDSGQGLGLCGLGWKVGPDPICRQTSRGYPLYDESDTFLGLNAEELVHVGNGTYRARNEGSFSLYRRDPNSGGWLVTLRDGTRLEYGVDPNGTTRITDKAGARVFQWLLESSTDTNGNVISYSYATLAGGERRKYLREIQYGPGAGRARTTGCFYFVAFEYEYTRRHTDCRGGFALRTDHRLRWINVGVQGLESYPSDCNDGYWNSDETNDALIRRYELQYDDAHPPLCFLVGITQYGADGTTPLPTTRFAYAVSDTARSVSARGHILGSKGTPNTLMDDGGAELVDLNADSLPDILVADVSGRHVGYLNRGVHVGENQAYLEWAQPANMSSADGLCARLTLLDPKVFLADMDGDGKADLVGTTPWGGVNYHRNTGQGAWGPLCYISVWREGPPSPFADSNVRTADLDGNRRIDIVESCTAGYRVWFNRGTTEYSQAVTTFGAFHGSKVLPFSDGSVRLADINGDHVTDVVQVTSKSLIYCAGLGHGHFLSGVPIEIQGTTLTDHPRGQVERARLEDVNGDGLADLVIERARINELWYWLNLGSDEFSARRVVTDLPEINDPRTVVRWADMNGNGTVDLVYVASRSEPHLRVLDIGVLISGTDHPNLLTRIDNGLGAVTQISYTTSTDSYVAAERRGGDRRWRTRLPSPVHVVTHVATTVAMPDANEVCATSIDYRSGYYNEDENEFWGFAWNRTTQHWGAVGPDTNDVLTTSEFHTGNRHQGEHACLRGKLRRLLIADGQARPYRCEERFWKPWVLYPGSEQPDVAFACSERTVEKVYEGEDRPAYLLSEFEYDKYGHITTELNYGVVGDPADPNTYALPVSDEIRTYRTFEPDTSRWILDLKTREDINDVNDVRWATRTFEYDPNGNLVSERAWLDSKSKYIPVVRNRYDGYGNILRVTDANDHVRTIVYDEQMHIYPVSERIHLEEDPCSVANDDRDLVLDVEYHLGYGTITQATDFSRAVSTYDYDVFGRVADINRPGGAWTRFAYDLANPREGRLVNCIVSKQRQHWGSDSTYDTYSYFDGLGRKLGAKAEAEYGLWRFVDATDFNRRGLPGRKWLPHFTASHEYERPDMEMAYQSLYYDALDRIIRTVHYDGSCTTMVREPLAEHIYDENHIYDERDEIVRKDGYAPTPKTLLYDGQERLIEVVERNREIGNEFDPAYEPNEYVTRYRWTCLGDLATVIDDHNNIKAFTYDSLGRKVLLHDPDRGMMHYAYDDVGNRVQTIDAKGQVVKYSYDAAGRVLSEDHVEPMAEHDVVDVAYFYDVPPDLEEVATRWGQWVDLADDALVESQNTTGRLAWVKDRSGSEFFSYDARGNVVRSSKHVRHPVSDAVTAYPVHFSHDPMDRVSHVTYPDGDEIAYQYNTASFVECIGGASSGVPIVANVDYEPTGRQGLVGYGNATYTTYEYDPNRQRLARLHTVGADGNDLLDYTYEYDNSSNITAIIDQRPIQGERHNTQFFQYDDLSRLMGVSYGNGIGHIDYTYDAIGNMLSKTSNILDEHAHIGDMRYGESNSADSLQGARPQGRFSRVGRGTGEAPGPHALTGTFNGTDARQYAYDDNGNMTHIDGDECKWDYKDRLVEYRKAGTSAEYAYDYAGRRVSKLVTGAAGAQTTLYPSRHFEIRPNQGHLKYVFNGDSRVAQYAGTLASVGANADICHYHGDHLGSTNVVTESGGSLVRETAYYPFGHPRSSYSPNHGSCVGSAYQFIGKEQDRESSLQYLEARYYAGRIGHFLSADPLSDSIPRHWLVQPQRLNAYSYASNNPLSVSDPTGMDGEELAISIGFELALGFEASDSLASPDAAIAAEVGVKGELKFGKRLDGDTDGPYSVEQEFSAGAEMKLGETQETLGYKVKKTGTGSTIREEYQKSRTTKGQESTSSREAKRTVSLKIKLGVVGVSREISFDPKEGTLTKSTAIIIFGVKFGVSTKTNAPMISGT